MALGTVASRFFDARSRQHDKETSTVSRTKEPFNPFYAVLLVAGILFAITACAYGVMAFKGLGTGPLVDDSPSGQGLLAFLDRYGVLLLTAELLVLGIATGGVIGWDQWAMGRSAANQHGARSRAGSPSETADARPAAGQTGDPR